MPGRVGPVKTYLVSGFLGAGKTTFILDQLNRTDANVAVLVNEFGTLGIDGDIIRIRGGVEVVEMPGGCVCCSQREDLAANIKAIVERRQPDALLIEPSGVAETPQLLRALNDKTLEGIVELSATIAVIDATTFSEFFIGFGAFFRTQIVNADIVIINKRDRVDSERLQAIERRVGVLNGRARIISTDRCHIDLRLSTDGEPFGAEYLDLPDDGPGHDHGEHGHGLGLDAVSFELAGPLSRQELDRFVFELSKGSFGDVLRAKGFIEMRDGGFVSLQGTSTAISTSPFEGRLSPRVTLIGRGLKEDAIASRLGTSRPE